MVFGIILFLVVLMLFCSLYTYSKLKITTAHIRNTAQQVLDTYTVSEGRKKVQSFKNGTDYTVALEKDLFEDQMRDALGIDDLTAYQNGRETFQISDMSLHYSVQDEIKSGVQFRIREPLYFMGKQVNALNETITVSSRYDPK